MNKLIFLYFFLIVSHESVFAQSKKNNSLFESGSWVEANISLTNGTSLNGFVQYDRNGLFLFKDDTAAYANLGTTDISSFKFFDSGNKVRTFYSLLFKDPEINRERPVFFEALFLFETFAVLSKTDPVEQNLKSSGGGFVPNGFSPGGTYAPPVVYSVLSQNETIFFADNEGNFSPYIKIIRKGDSRKGKVVVMELGSLSKYTEPYYQRLFDFSVKEKLRLDDKNDLIRILEYYKELLETKEK